VELRRGGQARLDLEESRRLAEDPLILRHLSVGTKDGPIELVDLATLAGPARAPRATLGLRLSRRFMRRRMPATAGKARL
jgi:hypothetical protein